MSEENKELRFRRFLKDVGDQWVELMSGGIITVALGFIERLTGKNFPLYVYLCVVFFFILYACFRAWRTAQKRTIEVQAELGERSKHKLALEVDTELYMIGWEPHQSGASMLGYVGGFSERILTDTPDIRQYHITAYLRVRCVSNDEYDSEIRTVSAHLVRTTTRGKIKLIRVIQEGVSTQKERGVVGGDTLDGLRVIAGATTDYYQYILRFQLKAKYGRKLNGDCFLRVTMRAARQEPQDVDLNIDWVKLRELNTYVHFTPRT